MSKALKFIGVFAGTAAIVMLLVVGLNYHSFKSMYDNRHSMAEGSEWVEYTYSMNGLTRYITENSDQVSLASIVPGNPAESVMFGENRPSTMGTLSGFFLLTGYADAFEQGSLNSEEEFKWEAAGKYVLPQIGEAVHLEAYRYGTDQGLISGDDRLTLSSALHILSKFNSPALSDFLLINFGQERMRQHYADLGLLHTDFPLPFSGLFITLAPSVQDLEPDEILSHWRAEPREKLEQSVYANTRMFADGPERDRIMTILRKERLGTTFMEERDLLELFPKTTASEIAYLLADIREGKRIHPAAGRQVIDWLHYPAGTETLARNFEEYGALYDNRVGLLNGLDIGTSARTGETKIQAMFFDRIHISVWFHMSSNHMHQDFQQRLIWDSDLIDTMQKAIES